jgi:hypothetical protein
LLGDDKYGDRERNAEMKQHGLKRTFLHASSVVFEWPGSGMPFHVSAPLPPELSAVLDAITPQKRRASPGRAAPGRAAPGRAAPGRAAPARVSPRGASASDAPKAVRRVAAKLDP